MKFSIAGIAWSISLVAFTAVLPAQTLPGWTQKVPQTNPPGRNDHMLAYDSMHSQVVLFGGAAHPEANDTWVWDGTNWTLKSPRTSPSARDSYAVAFDAAHGQVVLFAGANGNGPALNDTWTWDGSNWTLQSPPTSPSPRTRHAMAFDSTHGQVVLYGGLDSSNNLLSDTWVWDGANWTRRTPAAFPPARRGHRMAYDAVRGEVVMFGGRGAGFNYGDTWVWDGSSWTEKRPQTNPPARSFFGMAEDSARAQVVIFGGNSGTPTPLDDTWIWDGSNWIQRLPQRSPSARDDDALAYDAARDQVVLFGGGGLGDTWVWQGGSIPRISAGSQTIMASGERGTDTTSGPAYVQNPNAFSFVLTDGITTLTGQERKNSDPTGGPNKDLQAMTGFDGRSAIVSGTINAVSLADNQSGGSSQFIGIGLITQGAVDEAATTYNSDMGNTPAAGKDGFVGLKILWTNDQNGPQLILLAQDFNGQPDGLFYSLSANGLASGQSLTQPINFAMTFTTSSMALVVNGKSLGTMPVSHDLSSALLLVRDRSSNAADGTATLTFSNVVAATSTIVGPASVIFRVSGDSQSAPAASALKEPVVVGVVDSFRNPVPGATVSFTGTNATPNPTSVQTDANGQASTQVTLGNTVGTAQVAAAVVGLAGVNFDFTATVNATLPIVSAVVNGASFAGGGVVAGEIATAFGTALTSATGINLTSSLPLPGSFLNVSVVVGDPTQAPLFAVDNVNGQQQINFQVPWEVAGHANATIAVSNNGTMGSALNVPVLAAQPGIFSYSSGGSTFGAILHADFQLADTVHPAAAGETILIYCTGLGAVNNPPADGAAGSGQTTLATPAVTIGGSNAAVSFSGLAPGFVGLYQVNAVVPSGLASGNHPVVIQISGATSNAPLLPVK